MRIYNDDGSIKREDLNDEIFGCALPSAVSDANEDADEIGSKISNAPAHNPTDVGVKGYIEDIHVNEVHCGYNPGRYKDVMQNFHHKNELTKLLLQNGNVESLLLLSIVNNTVYKDICDAKSLKPSHADDVDAKSSNMDGTTLERRRVRLKSLQYTFQGIASDVVNGPSGSATADPFGSIMLDEGAGKNVASEVSANATNAEDLPDVFVGGIATCDDYDSDCSKRSEIFRSGIGSDAIDKTLRNFFERTCELHREVGEIGKCFLDYNKRLTNFKTEYLSLREEIKQRKYMDDLMLLLDGKVEEVKWKWPFKMGNADDDEFINLII